MSFWKPSKPPNEPLDTGRATKRRKSSRYGPAVCFEAKVLAIEAITSGADQHDVSDILGIKPTTTTKWMKIHRDEGLSGLCRKLSSIAVRNQCTELEKRIIAHRTDNPDHGVRRIRDKLRDKEGLEVSAENVRQTVNAAGVGNPPPVPHRRPAQVRRFERPTPNAMWQIDIFTFNLKQMYKAT